MTRKANRTVALSVFILVALASTACGKKGTPSSTAEGGSDARSSATPHPAQPTDSSTSPVVSVPARPAELLEVTRKYGPLVVRPGRFYAEAKRKPWSAWYLPVNSNYLFAPDGGKAAPLQKYDTYMASALGRRTSAADHERNDLNLYDPQAPNWAGRCHAWAVASVVEPEPRIAYRSSAGVDFSVGDLKALLIKSYERPEGLVSYGQRFTDSAGAVRDDIYPDQLHRLMQAELFELRKPFLIDTDPGIQVWNHPVFRAFVRIDQDPHDVTLLHVKTYLTIAKEVTNVDYIGTVESDQAYAYDLVGNPRPDGSVEVLFGSWKRESDAGGVNSIEDHPDFATAFPDDFKLEHQSLNPEIQVDAVQRILKEATEPRPVPAPDELL